MMKLYWPVIAEIWEHWQKDIWGKKQEQSNDQTGFKQSKSLARSSKIIPFGEIEHNCHNVTEKLWALLQ